MFAIPFSEGRGAGVCSDFCAQRTLLQLLKPGRYKILLPNVFVLLAEYPCPLRAGLAAVVLKHLVHGQILGLLLVDRVHPAVRKRCLTCARVALLLGALRFVPKVRLPLAFKICLIWNVTAEILLECDAGVHSDHTVSMHREPAIV